MVSTYVDEVIISNIKVRGTGKDQSSPLRIVTEVYTKDGELIAEKDDLKYTIEQIVAFVKKISPWNNLEALTENGIADHFNKFIHENR